MGGGRAARRGEGWYSGPVEGRWEESKTCVQECGERRNLEDAEEVLDTAAELVECRLAESGDKVKKWGLPFRKRH